jgi:hypothetical protein
LTVVSSRVLDHDVATAFQPYLLVEGPGELDLDAVMLEDRLAPLEQLDPVPQTGKELGREFPDAEVLLFRVDDDPVHVRGEHVAHGPEGKGELAMNKSGSARSLALLPDRIPVVDQVIHVRLQFGIRLSLRSGTDDGSHPVQADPFHDFVEPLPLHGILDPSGNADVPGPGEEHEVPAGESDVAGDPRPLGPQWFLGHLHDEMLALPDQSFDRGDELLLGEPGLMDVDVFREVLVPVLVGVELERRGNEVAGVQEPRLLYPDIHEGGLHPREDADDLPLEDVADDVPVVTAFEQEIDQDPGFERRDARLVRGGVDDDELVSFFHLIPFDGE